MPGLADFEVGQTVEIGDGQVGRVQFAGSTHFAPGDWIGVVFDEPVGKNDGSVQGQRYFDCPSGHGMFVRPAVAAILDQPTPKPAARSKGQANGATNKPRMSIAGHEGLKRASVEGNISKRQSINGSSPTPASRPTRLAGTSRSPTRLVGSSTPSTTSNSRTSTPTSTARKSIAGMSAKGRMSMAPPPLPPSAKRVARPSTGGALQSGSVNKPAPSSSSFSRAGHRTSIRSEQSDAMRSTSGESKTSQKSEISSAPDTAATPALTPPGEDSESKTTAEQAKKPLEDANPAADITQDRSASPDLSSQRGIGVAALRRENEDLATKLRLIEKRRAEDRERLKALDKVQADRERFEGIIQKLQAKYQPQQQELADLRRQLKEAEVKVESLEAFQAENETFNEMATLDKEMAEEMAETARLELSTLRQRHEELELEAEVLREENQELGKEMSPEEKTSQGWLQLERSNERYREALLRLRDVTQQQEAELRAQIDDLVADLETFEKTKLEASSAKERLKQSESNVEDLKQQLDNALGAEDMIEELASKNLSLNEKMADLRTTIEELESLKEVSDELEANHVETEKQLQEEIDYQEELLSEEARKHAIQEGNVQDLEYTVSRFRDLVGNLQSDLEDMKASQQLTETQANELSVRSRAIEDLNLKLNNTVTKAQAKAIEIELDKHKAKEATQHLAIMELFLPDSIQSDRDSVHAYLRFQRLDFKAKLLCDFIRESSLGAQRTDISDYSTLMVELTGVSSTCRRFIRNLESCGLDTFRRIGGASFDLVPVERAIDRWISAFERNELSVTHVLTELSSFMAMMEHMAGLHIDDSDEHFADLLVHRATILQYQLDVAAMTLAQVKKTLDEKASRLQSEAGFERLQDSFDTLDQILSHIRSGKVVSSKCLRHLEEMRNRHMTLNRSSLSEINSCQEAVDDIVSKVFELGGLLSTIFESAGEDLDIFSDGARDVLISAKHLLPKSEALTSLLQDFLNSMSSTQMIEFTPRSVKPPWKIASEQVHEASSALNAREEEVELLKEKITAKDTTIAARSKAADEMAVQLEVFRRRIGESGEHKDKIISLEKKLEEYQSRQTEMKGYQDQLQRQVELLQKERDHFKEVPKAAAPLSAKVDDDPPSPNIRMSEASLVQVKALQAEVSILQLSVRHLASEAKRRKFETAMDMLSESIAPAPAPTTSLASESRDVLKEMLRLVAEPDAQVVKLSPGSRDERLRWRPAKQSVEWQVQKSLEDWEAWREWRNDTAKLRTNRSKTKHQITGQGLFAGLAQTPSLSKPALTTEVTVVGTAD